MKPFTLFVCLVLLISTASSQSLKPGYGKASYTTSQAGQFMKTWLIAGPVAVAGVTGDPDNATQEKAFKEDALPTINVVNNKPVPAIQVKQQALPWKLVSSPTDAVLLDKAFDGKEKDYAYAYALAEIKADKPGTIMLGIGSDDGVKVWLNGKLIHENWIPRGISKDADVIPLQLVKGSNQLLLKVQDIAGSWGFMVRLLDKAALSDALAVALRAGDLERMHQLIVSGADVNARNSAGITPIVAAQISGREDVVQFLKKYGARDEGVLPAEALIDGMYASLDDKQASGIAVLVSKDGKILYEKGFGYADIKGKKTVTPETKFRIGSVTKQFTAAAILKLQENNLLNVNDRLSKYIPDFPRGNEVTIHHLLTHTSGIHSYTNKPDFINRVTGKISEDSLISSFKNDPYDFNPGENYMYNNSGYFLLGYIIGKVSGMPYGEYLKQTFLDPLGMKNTGIHYSGIQLENEALGYMTNAGKYEPAINWDMSWAGAAGAMYSTLRDLDTWNHALHSGKVISEKSLKAAVTTVELNGGRKSPVNYGYGLGTGSYRGVDYISHSGGLHGFISQLAYFPKQKLSVVMFSNNSNPEVGFDPNRIAEAFAWKEMEKQSANIATTVAPETLKLYLGRYDFSNGGVMQVTMNDNKLFAQLTGQPKLEIYPRSQDEFFWKVVDATIKFMKNEKGEITHAIFRQNGQTLNVAKLKDEPIITIDPALLDVYTGKYKMMTEVVTVTKENNKLYAQPTGQQKSELFPVADAQFILKDFNAKLTFVKDAAGKVSKIVLHMNGTDIDLPRLE